METTPAPAPRKVYVLAAIDHALALARRRGAAATIRNLEETRTATVELMESLRPFAALLHEGTVGSHAPQYHDSQPVFAINKAVITLGDLRRARTVLDAIGDTP